MKNIFTLFFAATLVLFCHFSEAQNINTIAGGLGDGGAATAAVLFNPNNLTVDKFGNIYIADMGNKTVRRIDASGTISIFAGTPRTSGGGTSGNGIPAIFAELSTPSGVAVDSAGNLFISDNNNSKIRKVNTDGIITDFTDIGSSAFGICIDKFNNIYAADFSNSRILKINPSGTISIFAGTGIAGFSGDAFPATAAKINHPTGICADKFGNIFIADNNNNRVRKINSSGIISTYAGNGIIGYAGDGGPATNANFNAVYGVCVDTIGNLYIADNNNNEIRMVNTSGIITRVAGAFLSGGFSGDGGTATSGQLSNPTGVTTDNNGNFYIADNGNNRIRKVNSSGTITTIAGCKFHLVPGYKGDGGPIISALLNNPNGLSFDTSNNLFIADQGNHCVRKINTSGIISTIAGIDTLGFSGDGGIATLAKLNNPNSVAADTKGNVYICDVYNYRIRKVNSSGIISTYAGNGTSGYSGDGGLATAASIQFPSAITTDIIGNLYISDNGNRIRKIDTNQVISTFAGTGISGYYGDGGPATSAQIRPLGIYADKTGNIYIADINNYRVRKIDPSGIITTVAGNGTSGISGLGGPAIFAGIGRPYGVTIDNSNNLFICSNNKILKVDTAGFISEYAGNGNANFFGDRGPALSASFNNTTGLIVDTSGNLILADNNNHRIRVIYNAHISIITSDDTVCAGSGATFTASVTTAPIYTPYYHWLKNGLAVGTNSPTYTATLLVNNDKITCTITDGPSGPSIATSNQITIYVPAGTPPTISISTTNSSVCAGKTVTCSPNSISNGGSSPTFDWFRNNVHVFTGSSYSFAPALHDSVYCRLTSSLGCTIPDTARSNKIIFNVIPYLPSAISISSLTGTVFCPGSSVTCTVSATTNAGSDPTYLWYKNNALIFSGHYASGRTYNFIPSDGDIIICRMKGDGNCLTPDTANSNTLTFNLALLVPPTVTISSSNGDTICPGTTLTADATSTLGGSSPQYLWYLNGSLIHNGVHFIFTPVNGDVLYCKLTSNSNCVSVDTALSNTITFVYDVIKYDSVAIVKNTSDTVCSGTSVTFTPIPLNGGSAPLYDWYRNNVKANSGTTYTLNPNNGDKIFCLMYSSTCVAPSPASSDTVRFTVSPTSTVHVSISADPGNTVCNGVPVTATATGINIGTAPVYDWFVNGNNLYSGNPFIFTPADQDNLFCRLTSNIPCPAQASVQSNNIQFHTDSIPSVIISCTPGLVNFKGTTITFYAYVPLFSGTIQLQWMKNSQPIPGATGSTYTSNDFSIWDSVQCVLTASGACNGSSLSNALVVNTYHSMTLYPNPSNGHFVINGNNYDADSDPVSIRIYNATGRLVFEKNAAFDAITFYTDIDLGRQVPPGVYFLRLKYDHGSSVHRFVIK